MYYTTTTRFRHIASTNVLSEIIEKETERLKGRHPRIQGFSISIDKPHRKHHKGNQVRVQILISLPRKRILITKEAEGMSESENAAIALNHAFDAADHAVDQYFKKKQQAGPETTTFRSFVIDDFGIQTS